jgi:predicted acetyltransferase
MYESTLRSFVREFAEAGEDLVPWVLADLGGDIAAYVEYLEQQSQGQNLPEGRVPHSTFWLVDDSGEIVAISNLRHRLNEFLSEVGGHIGFGVRPSARRRGFATEVLRCTLIEAQRLGIERIGYLRQGQPWIRRCNPKESRCTSGRDLVGCVFAGGPAFLDSRCRRVPLRQFNPNAHGLR